MTTGLRPYPEYKDSGLPWLGRVPAHWDVRRNSRLFAQRNETGYGSLPILEVSLKTGVRVRDMDDLKHKQMMSDHEKYKRAVKGDIAYNMMRMWQGAVGVAPEDGLVSPAYVVARPYPEAEPRYFSYLFRTDAYKNEVDGFSRGIVKDRNRIYWEDFKQMPSCFPPPDEQKIIADYLDAGVVKVRRFIRNRHRLIEVLNERKQAIINRAVTRGLDPNVTLKPSGIDWLGDIPEHWVVGRLKFIAKIIYGSSPHNSTYNADGIGTILVNGPDEYSCEDFGITRPLKWTTAPIKFAPKGALLFCLRGSTTGRLNICHSDVSIGRGVAALVPHGDKHYFSYAMMTLRGHLKATFRGSTFPSVTSSHLNNYWVPQPPITEQKPVAEYIDDATKSLNEAIAKATHEIALIREYRTRLIADVVTGKLDVRGLAPAGPLPADERIDEDIDDEDMPEDGEFEPDGEAADADD